LFASIFWSKVDWRALPGHQVGRQDFRSRDGGRNPDNAGAGAAWFANFRSGDPHRIEHSAER